MGVFRRIFAPDLFCSLKQSGREIAAVSRAMVAALGREGPETPGNAGSGGSEARRGCPPPGPHSLSVLVLGSLVAAVGAGIAGGGIVGLLTVPAGAKSIDPGVFGEADRATRDVLAFLGDLRGNFTDDGGPGGSSVLGGMLFIFNGGVLLLAGVLLIYYTVSATVDTAREGRWGFGTWEIVRIVVAIALMAPLPGGMNGAQHIVVGLAHVGGDFANVVWRPFSVEVLGSGKPVVPQPKESAFRAAISRTVLMETCRYVANEIARAAGNLPYIVIREEIVEENGAVVVHYNGARVGMPKDLCGSITFYGLADEGVRATAAAGHRAALVGVISAIRRIAADLGAHYVEGSPVEGQPLPDVDEMLRAARLAESYSTTIEAALVRAAGEEHVALLEAVAEDAARASWLSAASFFNTIARRAGVFQNAVHNVPATALPLPILTNVVPDAHVAVIGVLEALAGARDYSPMLSSVALRPVGVAAVSTDGGSGLDGGLLNVIDFESVTISQSGNPIADLASYGHGLINAALYALATLGGLAIGSGVLGFLGKFGRMGKGLDAFAAVWQVGDAFISTILALLLIAGVVLAYVLPAIPFIRFLFGIVSWIISVVVAVLSVTVFAAAHVMRGEGQGLTTSATRQGWLFLPGLILRPPLMLFGLILGYFVFLAGFGLFNDIWLVQMRDANAVDRLGPVGYLAMLTIYVMVAYGLMNVSFKLIDVLPNAALDWIGGRAGVDGEGADRLGGALIGGVSRLGTLRVGSPLGRGAGRPGP